MAQAAWAEADALRKATLALTQDLQMDSVLDTLLQSLLELVPYESAQILFVESELAACLWGATRIAPRRRNETMRYPLTLDATDYPLIQRVIAGQDSILLTDAVQEGARHGGGSEYPGSWLGVPLIASGRTLGLLSLGHSVAGTFTREHSAPCQTSRHPGGGGNSERPHV